MPSLADMVQTSAELMTEIEGENDPQEKEELEAELRRIEKMISVEETRLLDEEREEAYRAYGVSWAI